VCRWYGRSRCAREGDCRQYAARQARLENPGRRRGHRRGIKRRRIHDHWGTDSRREGSRQQSYRSHRESDRVVSDEGGESRVRDPARKDRSIGLGGRALSRANSEACRRGFRMVRLSGAGDRRRLIRGVGDFRTPSSAGKRAHSGHQCTYYRVSLRTWVGNACIDYRGCRTRSETGCSYQRCGGARVDGKGGYPGGR